MASVGGAGLPGQENQPFLELPPQLALTIVGRTCVLGTGSPGDELLCLHRDRHPELTSHASEFCREDPTERERHREVSAKGETKTLKSGTITEPVRCTDFTHCQA